MPYSHVKLGKSIQPDKLEQILVDAAKEVGYKAKVRDLTREHYELLEDGFVQEYKETVIRLKKLFIPLMEVYFSRHRPNDSLWIDYGFGFGLSTRSTAEKYLAAVSKQLFLSGYS